MGPRQPNSAFINFRDVWSPFRQLLLFRGELRPLGSCLRGDVKGEAAPLGSRRRAWARGAESLLCHSLAVWP